MQGTGNSFLPEGDMFLGESIILTLHHVFGTCHSHNVEELPQILASKSYGCFTQMREEIGSMVCNKIAKYLLKCSDIFPCPVGICCGDLSSCRALSLMNWSVCLSSLACVLSFCWSLSGCHCHTMGNTGSI